ncbi:hybrid sensor histidine kinase/response regulator [Melittangium boletus]|uniref:histidine kinase n=1 Tax=Melittangium boletus DSM 14713 TaxID=1294270 RepID=A0A250IDQ6_9BACT|nr:hybrid sensor histidine kinase/response regulator [Melittangium boletus]ATB29373.1 hybrid sensor histidine kinase/response regulator [Melittangium boletus DSM 14713]
MQAREVPHTSVLLVDDQPADLETLKRHLQPFSLRLVMCNSGEEALARWEEEDFALVLMDVRLPGLDGIETARRLRAQDAPRSVPLIFLTGAEREEESIADGYDTGGVDWLRKPVDPRVLRAKVGVFVDLHREREALRQQQLALRERAREILEAKRERSEARRQRAEAERERLVVELREAVRLRDEFLSVASHELRTPLTPLALRLHVMRQELKKDALDVERMLGHLDAANAQVKRLTGLVDSLLDATRLAHGQLMLRRERDVDLVAIVRDVVSAFETQAASAHCTLELELPARVLGQWDVLRLQQIITHLVSNALKFGAGGTVRLRLEEHDGWARLSVRDEGIGMDESVRARIFGRFERGVSERHYGGLGLGLFITRQVVEAKGGRIHVDSAPGQGSVFTVELPCVAGGEAGEGGSHEA